MKYRADSSFVWHLSNACAANARFWWDDGRGVRDQGLMPWPQDGAGKAEHSELGPTGRPQWQPLQSSPTIPVAQAIGGHARTSRILDQIGRGRSPSNDPEPVIAGRIPPNAVQVSQVTWHSRPPAQRQARCNAGAPGPSPASAKMQLPRQGQQLPSLIPA